MTSPIHKLAQNIAHSVLGHLERTKRFNHDRDGAGRIETSTVTREVEATVKEHLWKLYHQLCPRGAILFNITEEDDAYRINVLAGDRFVGGGPIPIGLPDGTQGSIAMALSEFAAEFEGCITPGQALAVYGEALDSILAREAWRNRQSGEDDR